MKYLKMIRERAFMEKSVIFGGLYSIILALAFKNDMIYKRARFTYGRKSDGTYGYSEEFPAIFLSEDFFLFLGIGFILIFIIFGGKKELSDK